MHARLRKANEALYVKRVALSQKVAAEKTKKAVELGLIVTDNGTSNGNCVGNGLDMVVVMSLAVVVVTVLVVVLVLVNGLGDSFGSDIGIAVGNAVCNGNGSRNHCNKIDVMKLKCINDIIIEVKMIVRR